MIDTAPPSSVTPASELSGTASFPGFDRRVIVKTGEVSINVPGEDGSRWLRLPPALTC